MNFFKYQCNQRQLKILAVVTMLADHIGVILVEPIIYQQIEFGHNSNTLISLFYCLRIMGRIAFPIYCFLLVEGFLHTHNVKNYFKQLLLFAILSEIPFDIAFGGEIFFPSYQNVFFTLALGLLVLCGLKRYEKSKGLQLFIVILGCLSAHFLNTDYSYFGIILIALFYIFHDRLLWRDLSVGGILIWETFVVYGLGIFALIPIHLYNQEKGLIKYKYFYYAFYPVHLVLLYVLHLWIMYML